MLGRTLLALSSLEPGFNVHDAMAARFALSPGTLGDPEQVRTAWQVVLDRARRVPGVDSVALADIIPMREGENSLPYWTSATPPPPNQWPVALTSGRCGGNCGARPAIKPCMKSIPWNSS